MEAETTIITRMEGLKELILVSDQKQLPAIVISKVMSDPDLTPGTNYHGLCSSTLLKGLSRMLSNMFYKFGCIRLRLSWSSELFSGAICQNHPHAVPRSPKSSQSLASASERIHGTLRLSGTLHSVLQKTAPLPT